MNISKKKSRKTNLENEIIFTSSRGQILKQLEKFDSPTSAAPHIFMVDVNYHDKNDVDEIAMKTPTNHEETPFGDHVWWIKIDEEMWFPSDKYIASIQNQKNKLERIFGFWVSLTSSKCNINNCADRDSAISFFRQTQKNEATAGPSDPNWKMPLWMKAQRFRLTCYDRPCMEGVSVPCDDEWLDGLLDESHCSTLQSLKRKRRFLVVDFDEDFAPKQVDRSEYILIS